MSLSKIQKEVLNALIDVYEDSATYKGINTKNQTFSIKPEKIFVEYNDDYTDQEEVIEFNKEMKLLEEEKYVVLKYIKGTFVIDKIFLNINFLSRVYQSVNREDITQKRNQEIKVYSEYIGIHYILDAFCQEQIDKLSNFKNARFAIDIAVDVLRLLKYVLINKVDIMERELSIAILGDTKAFEKFYRTRICNIIEEYGENKMDLSIFEKREKEKVILEEYNVFSNPSYIFFKGEVELKYNDGEYTYAKSDKPIAISSETIERLEMIKVNSNKIITVENLTSYNRIKDNASTFIFISGYHNTAKQKLLKKIAYDNKDVAWYHFGDIDPDGFYILKNLLEKTGICFEPWKMDIQQLKEYRQYCKPLNQNDISKASSLIDMLFYKEVMEYMIKNNCKLEQEIISWLM